MSMNKLIETCKAEIEFNSPTAENYSKLIAEVERMTISNLVYYGDKLEQKGSPELAIKFCAAIKAMLEWANTNERSYISHKNAEPFTRDLPEFWREPARVMASLGYYGSADEWMKQNMEDGR